VLIPSEIRKRIKSDIHGKDFIFRAGPNQKLWLYPDKFYEYLAGMMKPDMASNSEATSFDRRTFALSQLVELDPQGRVLLPIRSFSDLGLEHKKNFFLIGVRDHLELWLDTDWMTERKKLLGSGPE
jgi:DNA-binding transcriptional regulator/RsmH inhibitor MraZ